MSRIENIKSLVESLVELDLTVSEIRDLVLNYNPDEKTKYDYKIKSEVHVVSRLLQKVQYCVESSITIGDCTYRYMFSSITFSKIDEHLLDIFELERDINRSDNHNLTLLNHGFECKSETDGIISKMFKHGYYK